MATIQQTLTTNPKAMFGGTDTGTESASLLYMLLPPIIHRRVSSFRSPRRTSSSSSIPQRHSRAGSDTSIASITPPPSYRNSIVYDESCPAFSSLPPSRPSSSGSVTPLLNREPRDEIECKYAQHGQTLLAMSMQEVGSLSHSPGLRRRLYLDSLTYLLQGLPSNLSTDEELSLRAALPPSLLPAISLETQLTLSSGDKSGTDTSARTTDSAQSSSVQRAIATMVFYAFVAISIVLPYVQLLAQQAYQYERRYKVREWLASQGVVAADSIGKQTLALATGAYALQNSKFGHTIKEVGGWWLQSVSLGVCDGVGEGMEVMGRTTQLERDQSIYTRL